MGKDTQNWFAWFSGFSKFGQLTFDMGVFIRSMGSPDCEDIKIAMEEAHFAVPDLPPLFGVLGAWMTFKKAEMKKTLKNVF